MLFRSKQMTLADAAKAVDLPRASVRRTLMTLVTLGYAETDGRLFRLTPRILTLANAYLSSNATSDIIQPALPPNKINAGPCPSGPRPAAFRSSDSSHCSTRCRVAIQRACARHARQCQDTSNAAGMNATQTVSGQCQGYRRVQASPKPISHSFG